MLSSLSPDFYLSDIQQWKEKTSTSPSGCHLRHYQSINLPLMKDEAKDIQDNFLYIYATVINLAIKYQVVFPRWEKVDTLCIPKDWRIPKITRLGLLNLYKADLNFLQRILIACRLIWDAEYHQLFPENNWGGQQLHSSGDLGLQKVLTLELNSLTQTTFGQIDLNAKACYD